MRFYVFQAIVVGELISRAVKHLFTTFIQGVEATILASAISHFMNCLLSSCQSLPSPSVEELQLRPAKSRRGKKRGRQNVLAVQDSTEWTALSSKSLWASIAAELDSYYGWQLQADGVDSAVEGYGFQKMPLLRAFCLKSGVQLLLRDYSLDSKSKPSFAEEDILNVFPVVKHIHPRATDAYNFYTTGQTKIQQGFLKEGYELISEALNLLNNVYGAMHSEVSPLGSLRTLFASKATLYTVN